MGVIYILTNPAFPDYVKIGYTKNIEDRLRQLNRSETIPYAFRVYAVYEVDSELTDKELHKLIDTLNPNLRAVDNVDGKERVKEFYAMRVEDAYLLLECIAKISGTQDRLKRLTSNGHEVLKEDESDTNNCLNRREPFHFSQCGISVGEEVQLIDDVLDVKAVVVDDRHVEYAGERTSLSALAQKLKGFTHPVQGPLWFTYHGKCLDELRKEQEASPQKTSQTSMSKILEQHAATLNADKRSQDIRQANAFQQEKDTVI